MSILDMFSKKDEPKKVEEVKEEKTLTEEEKKHKELLAKRLEELRKRDPFIYK
jgi:TATA-binding protein-associated factor Taf7